MSIPAPNLILFGKQIAADKIACEGSQDKVTVALRHILRILPLKTASLDEKRGTSETHRHRQRSHRHSNKDCSEAFSSHRLPNTYDSHQTLGEARKDREGIGSS